MRYQSRSSVSYLFRNFWQLFPFGVVAAVLLGYVCSPTTEISFAEAFLNGTVNADNFLTAILRTVTVLRFGSKWWVLLVALVALVFAESVLAIKVSRHMRTGEMVFLPLKRAFAVLPTMVLFVLCLTLFVEIQNLVVAGVAYLLRALGKMTVAIVVGVLLVLMKVIAMFMLGMLLFAFPIMFIENYNFNQALAYSVRLASEKRKYLWVLTVLYTVSKIFFTVVCGIVNITWVTYLLFSLFYLACVLEMPCLTFKIYCDCVGSERRDIGCVMFDR